MHSPPHDAVALQLTELLSEHLGADLGNPPIQFSRAERAVPQFKEDERLPLAADVAEGRGDRTFFVTHRLERHLINTGAWASARFNVGRPVDSRPVFANGKLKRRERRAPFRIYEMSSTYFLVSIAQNSAYLQELRNGINCRQSKLFYGQND